MTDSALTVNERTGTIDRDMSPVLDRLTDGLHLSARRVILEHTFDQLAGGEYGRGDYR